MIIRTDILNLRDEASLMSDLELKWYCGEVDRMINPSTRFLTIRKIYSQELEMREEIKKIESL